MSLWQQIRRYAFTPAPEASPRARRDFSKFALGVCPRCRSVRAVASPACAHCDSRAPVIEDA